jgi:glycine hydroxymethyltransferase
MGTLDAKGPGAAAFLDAVTTNDVQRLSVGDSHYTFLLDVNGVPFDDLLIYRLADDHFFIVVNASNNDKNWQWLNAVKNGDVRLDNNLPQRRITDLPFALRDLRAESSGADCRVDIALQGPESREKLLQLADSDDDKASIQGLRWAQITRVSLQGRDVLVSRTGYTGERIAYELFPHPDDAVFFFEKLVSLGVVPCGLAARDSLRIEAGLPLYGHELNGPLTLNPADAGMGSYVKLYKPFFVGKQAFITHEIGRDTEITRFRMSNKRARPAHQGDPIVDSRGRVVGVVTSCSIDSDGYQLGQAYLKQEYRKAGTELAVFAGSQRLRERDVSQAGLGDRTNIPEPITVLRRFPKR